MMQMSTSNFKRIFLCIRRYVPPAQATCDLEIRRGIHTKLAGKRTDSKVVAANGHPSPSEYRFVHLTWRNVFEFRNHQLWRPNDSHSIGR